MIFERGNASAQDAVALAEVNNPVFEGDNAHGVSDAHGSRFYPFSCSTSRASAHRPWAFPSAALSDLTSSYLFNIQSIATLWSHRGRMLRLSATIIGIVARIAYVLPP